MIDKDDEQDFLSIEVGQRQFYEMFAEEFLDLYLGAWCKSWLDQFKAD